MEVRNECHYQFGLEKLSEIAVWIVQIGQETAEIFKFSLFSSLQNIPSDASAFSRRNLSSWPNFALGTEFRCVNLISFPKIIKLGPLKIFDFFFKGKFEKYENAPKLGQFTKNWNSHYEEERWAIL